MLETKVKALQSELMSKFDEIKELEQRISDVSYKLKKSKPILSIKNVLNHNILPSSTLPNTQPYAVQPTPYHVTEPSTPFPLVMEDVYTDEEYARNRENVRKTLEIIDAARNFNNG